MEDTTDSANFAAVEDLQATHPVTAAFIDQTPLIDNHPLNSTRMNGAQLVVEVSELTYQETTIKIFNSGVKINNSPRFFFEPIVVLDSTSVVIQPQNLFKEDVVRFTIQMWNADLRSKVVERLRLDCSTEITDKDVSVMPYEDIRLVGQRGSIHKSIKIMEEAIPYNRLNEKLDFFLLCDSPSTATSLAENLRHYPELIVRKWKLALECSEPALNTFMNDDKTRQMKRPLSRLLLVSTSTTTSESRQELTSNEKEESRPTASAIGIDATAPMFQAGGSGGEIKNIPMPPRFEGFPIEPVVSSTPMPPHLRNQPNSQRHRKSNNRGHRQQQQISPTSVINTTDPAYTYGAGSRDGVTPAMHWPHLLTSVPPPPMNLDGLTPKPLEPVWKQMRHADNKIVSHPAAVSCGIQERFSRYVGVLVDRLIFFKSNSIVLCVIVQAVGSRRG